METTLTVLSRIADGVATSWLDVAVGLGQLAAVIISLVALYLAVRAFLGERFSRSADALDRLFEHFDASGYFLRMWRMDQATRTDGPASIGAGRDVLSLLNDQRPVIAALSRESLASDWSVSRADMYGVYFFAVRLNTWLTTSRDGSQMDRVSLLNGTFGHQLMSTFLDHRIVACRLRRLGHEASYYPTHYGLFDPEYTSLFNQLADDLLAPGRLSGEVADPMRAKRSATDDYLKTIRPLKAVEDPTEDVANEHKPQT